MTKNQVPPVVDMPMANADAFACIRVYTLQIQMFTRFKIIHKNQHYMACRPPMVAD